VSAVPERPKLYHITHVDNLASILRDGALFSEAALLERGGPDAAVGMGHIKERRFKIPVPCHPGTVVADYIPFYFCPRSVMLYLLYKGNHPELAYKGGQDAIVHLEYDFEELVSWAQGEARAWALAPTSAGAFYTQFFADRSALGRLDWSAIGAGDWRASGVREHKQAEFLLLESAPWALVARVGVIDNSIRDRVLSLLGSAAIPLVEVQREWYY
jgi:hypothetical protein